MKIIKNGILIVAGKDAFMKGATERLGLFALTLNH